MNLTREGARICRYGQAVLAQRPGGMLLNFLGRSHVARILFVGDEKTALNPRSSGKLQYEGRGKLPYTEYCWRLWNVVVVEAICINPGETERDGLIGIVRGYEAVQIVRKICRK